MKLLLFESYWIIIYLSLTKVYDHGHFVLRLISFRSVGGEIIKNFLQGFPDMVKK